MRWRRIWLRMKVTLWRQKLGYWITGNSRSKDREHIVQLSRAETLKMIEAAQRGGFGSWRPEGEARNRLSVEAVENGGLLIRTQPYRIVDSHGRWGTKSSGYVEMTTFR